MERIGLRLAQESVRPLYERTRRFRVYSPGLVPGILQTEAYTRAVLPGFMRRRRLPDDIDAAVAVRMERQRFLYEGNHRYAVLMEQSALWSGVGGANVTTGQLGHLITVSSLPSVSLGIIPTRPDREIAWPARTAPICSTSRCDSPRHPAALCTASTSVQIASWPRSSVPSRFDPSCR
jgi:hypothetical protein